MLAKMQAAETTTHFRTANKCYKQINLRRRVPAPCKTPAKALPVGAQAVDTDHISSDEDREQGRQYRRVVFDQKRWEQHRSIQRYAWHMSGILTSRIARGLFGPMSYVASICFGVCLYHSLLEYNILQQWVAPDLDWPTINLNSSGIFSISTFALSLLLVFRTNSSYERWWEARDCWRMIVNECTHLARQTEQWLPGPASEPVRSALLRWLHVFPISLMVHLRGHEEDLRQEVQGLLPPDELELLLRARNPPLLVLSAIGQIMAVSEMRIESKTHMDESVRVLQESLGSCEKLLTTPIPLSYTRHTGRFLVLWLTCLPFVIWQELGWLSVPISMVVSFLLFGIEEIGVQIEEPFGILALESYCDEVKAGINQATADANMLLPITLKLTGGKVSDCLPGDFAVQQLQLQELAGTAAAAAACATAGQLQQGLSLQQVQQAQQLQQVQQAQQLVQAVAVNGASHSHSTQHHQ